MIALAHLLALTAILLAFQHLVRRYAAVAWTSLAIVPAALTPYWLQTPHTDVFFWIKLYTVLLGTAWVIAVRHSPLGRKHWALQTIFWFAAVNMLEAAVKDLLGGHLLHHLNAATGFLLVATLAAGREAIVADPANPYRDLQWDPFRCRMTWVWLASYALWNWTFVYLNYPHLAGLGAAALIAPFLAAIGDRANFAQARVYSLAGAMLMLFTFPQLCAGPGDGGAVTNPACAQVAVTLGLASTCCFALWLAWARNRRVGIAHQNSRPLTA